MGKYLENFNCVYISNEHTIVKRSIFKHSVYLTNTKLKQQYYLKPDKIINKTRVKLLNKILKMTES